MEPHGVINALANNLGREFLGYASQGGGFNFTSSRGIVRNNGNYTSKYKDATWSSSDQDKDMAQIFLGAATITFLGLSYLYFMCRDSRGWSGETLNNSNSGLKTFMPSVGYNFTYLNNDKHGRDIASLLDENEKGFDGLAKHDGYSMYSNLVKKLEAEYKPEGANALNSPLTACYKFAKLYFTSQFKKPKSEVMDQTLTSIKEALNTFKSSCKTSAPDLYDQIDNFISTVMPDPSSDHYSPAGPVAGTLTTLGLGGGAAAAYILDIGGAKTLVNGLLKIG
ncbi:variant erythrocyte surface antigen-1, beta subunit [Babesia caballi]|uniref:Variant erythrocyte surface antigen-1, beta subunit n=1 Tax=Babesia caballi TaxID=5871 RepID=A0AAV4LR06_BABCB|nr:variant erythrocyte surface antigen-1, beta subunit [Babesia caballi]